MPDKPAKLIVRNAETRDIPGIIDMSERVYGTGMGYGPSEILGQINRFPDGQFVAEYEGRIVGYCATFIISGEVALKPHTWTGNPPARALPPRHDPGNGMLYGMDVMVHPITGACASGGASTIAGTEDLCQWLELKGIVFGGRMPGYARHAKDYPDPKDYINAVLDQKLKDPVINFQLRQGFRPIGVMRSYLLSRPVEGLRHPHAVGKPAGTGQDQGKAGLGDTPCPSVCVLTVQFRCAIITSSNSEQRIEDDCDGHRRRLQGGLRGVPGTLHAAAPVA
ncbi:MAG: hypothetical protein R3C04_10345 [Hyphomonas sp.]